MAAPNSCYYKTLGVDSKADLQTINKAYRQLAKQYHPDRNVGDDDAKMKYAEVSEAYENLSDPVKRSRYDSRFSSSFNFQSFNLNDFFSSVSNSVPKQQNWGQNIETSLTIDFIESAKGCTKNLNIERRQTCKNCRGTGAKDGKDFKKCVLCDGSGKEVRINSNMRFETSCGSCLGTGKVIGEFCDVCGSKGFTLVTSCLEIKIPAGINNGMKICVRGEGDIGLNGPGSLYCVIRVVPHPLFQRDGINLCLKVPVGYAQAALGGEINVPCLDGICKFKIPAGTRSGSTFRLQGLGFKLPDDDETSQGDMLIKVVVDAPIFEDIPCEYKEILEKLALLEKTHPGTLCKSYDKTVESLGRNNDEQN